VHGVTESEVADLVQRVAQGDNGAFDRLMRVFSTSVMCYLRRFISHRENVEDLVQEAFLNAYLAIRKGRYEHINQAALAGWLRRIAWHVMIQRREPEVEEFVDTLENIPEVRAGVAQEVGDQRLFEFLLRQFDEVLIEAEATPQGRGIGLLKKMAFLRFYVDGLSQTETVTAILEYASRIGVTVPVDRVMVNNWIARGDILKLLVHHLVEQHREMLGKLTAPEDICPSLREPEKQALDMHWKQGRNEEAISAATGLPPAQVRKALRCARRKVADGLARVIKKELHDLRYEDRGRGSATIS
jgi:RNA polymerase sigma factor (sigma-70 family)